MYESGERTVWDEIRIEKLEVYAYHGVYPFETKNGQTFIINATLYTNTEPAGLEDNLELSTNYGDVCMFLHDWMKKHTCKLLEAVAEKLAEAVLLQFPLIHHMDLEIKKPEAPIKLPFENVSVKITRGWHKAYIALGSNMGDRNAYLEGGIRALEKQERIRLGRVSDFLVTKPYGGVEQEDFLNGVAEVDTLLSPEELLVVLHRIEEEAGRERLVHWGPRTLDLDILFYDQLVYHSETLTIPHGDLQNRDFVLIPLSQLAPLYRHPISGKTVDRMKQELQNGESNISIC